jgi:nitrous oxidase accessory protein
MPRTLLVRRTHLDARAVLLALALTGSAAVAAPPLQLFVDITPAGGTLRPLPGTYAGPVVVTKPITIDGGGEVIVDGGGDGSVLTVRAPGSRLRGLRIVNSGGKFDSVDAGVLVEADDVHIEDNVVADALFGIHLKGARDGTVRGNRISSRGDDPNLRGDAIRAWYSSGNRIEGNEIRHSRDLVFTNSPENRIAGNDVRDSRVGMHFVFSPGNVVEGNTLHGNETGIMVLYSDDLTLRGNRLWNARHASGAALALKESVNLTVEDNEIVHNAVGISANAPNQPEHAITLRGNRFAYNDVAIYFYGEKGGHRIEGNRFERNFTDVAVSHPVAARGHLWRGNHWDSYQGFDRDGDGVGDFPHQVFLYADRIWMDRPLTRFFRASLALELIDFLERLAPFSTPEPVLVDPLPRVD